MSIPSKAPTIRSQDVASAHAQLYVQMGNITPLSHVHWVMVPNTKRPIFLLGV